MNCFAEKKDLQQSFALLFSICFEKQRTGLFNY